MGEGINVATKTVGRQLPPDPNNSIGNILLHLGLLTEQQLAVALKFKDSQKNYMPLGQACIQLGFISHEKLYAVIRKYNINLPIGELLVNMNHIDQETLSQTIATSKLRQCKLGETLISQGHISQKAFLKALSVQLGIPYIEFNDSEVDANLLKDININFLRNANCVPLNITNNVLNVAMEDPLNNEVIKTLEDFYRVKVNPVLCRSEELRNYYDVAYSTVPNTKTDKYAIYAPVSSDDNKDLIVDDDIDDDTIVGMFNTIVINAVRERASDIHIEPLDDKIRVRYRIDGVMIVKDSLPLSVMRPLISRIKILSKLDISERRKHQDGRIKSKIMDREVDLRISTYVMPNGESVVIRIISSATTQISMEELGFNPFLYKVYMKLLTDNAGVTLVTGPTGSGKTTTLYASLHELNCDDVKIITVEDPIEYNIQGVIQGSINSKINQDYMDFLKSMMRQDPDVLMLGEIRDKTAAEAVIQAALTGHKVFTTFHTEETTSALLRLMDMGIDTFLISTTIVSVISQRLVRTLCPHCKEEYIPDADALSTFNSIKDIDFERHKFYRPVGCEHCDDIGYRGRTSVHELLVINDPVRRAIFERQNSGLIRNIARQTAQLISMREDGFYKVMRGLTTIDEIIRVTPNSETDSFYKHSVDDLIAYCDGTKPIPVSSEIVIGEVPNTTIESSVSSTPEVDDRIEQLEARIAELSKPKKAARKTKKKAATKKTNSKKPE